MNFIYVLHFVTLFRKAKMNIDAQSRFYTCMTNFGHEIIRTLIEAKKKKIRFLENESWE